MPKLKYLLLCFIGIVFLNVSAQEIIKLHNLSIDENTGLPRWAEISTDQKIREDNFFIWLRNTYSIPERSEFKLQRSDTDGIGFVHKRYIQFYQGKQIINSTLLVHLKDGFVESFNGEYYNSIEDYAPSISSAAARDKLLGSYGNVLFKWQVPEEEKLLKLILNDPDATWFPKSIPTVYGFYKTGTGYSVIPCYSVHVGIAKPRKDEIVLLDIRNGNPVLTLPQEVDTDSSGKAYTYYEGIRNITSNFLLKDSFSLEESGKRHVSTYKLSIGTNFYDRDNIWNNGTDKIAGDIHYGGELVSDFMKKYFQKNSYDGKGGTITMVTSSGSGNAFWNLSSNYATFLVGSTSSVGPCASLDVVGHELGHGIADEITGLQYSGEACALHESFADINGHMTELTSDSGKQNWWLGEKVWASSNGIRYMRDPWKFSNPKAYGGKYWPNGCHGNGGVQNYWYYIMVKGDTATNEYGYVYKLKGLGYWKAAQIHYRSYFYYLTPSATFKDALKGTIKAARDLYGGCSDEIDYVFKAWKAVNVEDTSIKAVDLSHGINTSTLLCSGAPVNSSLSSFGDLSRSVNWTIDYKDTSSKKSFVYSFKNTGIHNIVLKTNTCGKLFYDSMKVIVNFKPDPQFKKPFDTACAGNNTVTFTNTTINADKIIPLKYYWFVNPGASSDTTRDLKTTFPDGMDYEIQLKAYYQGGCWAVKKQMVSLIQKPHPTFDVLKNVCQNRELKLKNTSDTSSIPVKFIWYFPDTTTYSGFNPAGKTLRNYGSFNIVLNANYLGGKCTDTAKRKIEIYRNPLLTISYANNCKNKIMLLTGTGNYASPKDWSQWHLGSSNPFNKDTVKLMLNDSNSRLIGFTAGDKNGCYSTVYNTINIGYANASGTISSNCLGSAATLTNTSSASTGYTSLWNLGNGKQISGDAKTYLYSAAGSYHSELVVQSGNCRDTARFINEIWDTPLANYSVSAVCADDSSRFINQTPDKKKLKCIWYFGDNDSSNAIDPVHKYSITKSTTYFVTLKTITDKGCENTITKTANVIELPKCDFMVSNMNNNPAAFTYKMNNAYTGTYKWKFGDGDSSTLENPVHVYQSSGNYITTLRFTNSAGCGCTLNNKVNAGVNALNGLLPGNIRIFPNPVNEILFVYNDNKNPNDLLQINIVNTEGKIVYKTELPSSAYAAYDLSGISPGMYILKIQFNGSIYHQKIIKN